MPEEKIWLSSPHMGGEEERFVSEAFESNWIAPLGPNVNGFEQDLQDYSGVAHASVLTSGTAAIHLALIILNVQRGDEVLVSTFTFSGSINPIIYQGATPIMVESEADTWNMSPTFLEEAIVDRIRETGKAPKAVVLVDLYGMPAQLDELVSICRNYNVAIIEDAAEALGSSYKGRKLGSFGDFGVYSFNGNKIITTSGGGALISNNKEWIDKSRFLSTQARDKALHYEHSEIGYNYRMSNIVAGVGRGQMLVLDKWVEKRRAINLFYKEVFKNVQGVSFLEEPDSNYYSNHWLTCITFEGDDGGIRRDQLIEAMAKRNIECRPLWKPMHIQPVFESFSYYGDNFSVKLFETGVCLPSGSNMSEDDLERIRSVIQS